MAEITLERLAALILEVRAEINAKLASIEETLAQHTEDIGDLRDRMEILQGSIMRVDGKGVEAPALLRMLERLGRRVKALEDRTKQ